MIITLNGDEGAGKSTVAKKIAEELSYKHYYTGQFFRDLAKKRDLTVVEYSRLGETDASVDREIDDYTIDLAKREDNFVIDSRMAWHFIPGSIKIFLKVNEKVGAERVHQNLQEKNSRNEVKENLSVNELMAKIKERKESDRKRYIMYYNADNHNMDNYDYVLDTTTLSVEEVFEKVMNFIKSKMSNVQSS